MEMWVWVVVYEGVALMVDDKGTCCCYGEVRMSASTDKCHVHTYAHCHAHETCELLGSKLKGP